MIVSKSKRLVSSLVFLLFVGALLVSCAPTADTGTSADVSVQPPANLVEKGKLTYGVAATFPPFEYKDGELYKGFDVEMGEALAKYMGLEVSILDMDFDGLIPALQGGRIDILNSAMYIKPERAEQVDFIPYMRIGEAIVVPKGNPKGIKSLDDLAGLTVAVTRGAVEEIYANEQNEKFASEGKEQMTILALPTAPDSVLATEQGRADAFFTSLPGASFMLEDQGDVFEIAGTFDLETQIGIAVRKGNTEMKQAIEAALEKFVDDGSYAQLLEKYNLPEEVSIFE